MFLRYWREVDSVPLLSAEAQHDLAVRYAKTGDPKLARRLVAANLRLVVKIAHDYRPSREQFADVVQEGNLGLMRAVEKFDPARGSKLTTYAAWWIRAYMMRFLLERTRVVKAGTTRAARRAFASGQAAPPDLSLDQPLRPDQPGCDSFLDCLEDADAQPADVVLERLELLSKFSAALRTFRDNLDARQRSVLKNRWLDESPWTLARVGTDLSVSAERARQLEQNILTRLRGVVAAQLAA